MIGSLIVQALLVVVGYVVALMAALTVAMLGASVAAANLAADLAASPQGDYAPLVDFTVATMGVGFQTLTQAVVPSIIAIALAEVFRLRHVVTYLLAGCVIGLFTALPVDQVMATGFPLFPLDSGLLRISVAAAAVGAFFYWLIAGRRAGCWLDTGDLASDPR